jgi:hypothetical protein
VDEALNCSIWKPNWKFAVPAPAPAGKSSPEGGTSGRLLEPLRAMLLLWMTVVSASALAAPAPPADHRRGVAGTPNVVLVVSDSFVSTEAGLGGTPPGPATAHRSPPGLQVAGCGERGLRCLQARLTQM